MEATPQKRLVRRLDLERRLLTVEAHPSPKAFLEQYTIPADVASEVLFIAAQMNNDIIGKSVIDLGCGTGRLAIGAVLLGASESIGIDLDKSAIAMARRNAVKVGVENRTQWIAGDIDVLHGNSHTVLQNPPFGVQRRSADRKFLIRALESAPVVYSLHKSGEGNRVFIKRFIERRGGKVTSIYQMKLNIPRMFEFHTQRKHRVEVDLYRIESAGRSKHVSSTI